MCLFYLLELLVVSKAKLIPINMFTETQSQKNIENIEEKITV